MARCTDKVCQWLATGLLFSLGTPVSSTTKTDRHDITEISLKVALSIITLTPNPVFNYDMLKDIDDIKEDNIAFYVQYDLSLWYEIKLISPKIF